MPNAHFLWPKSKPRRALLHAASCVPIESIEQRLAEMFSGGNPVLFSSGRSALAHALAGSSLSRGDMVGVFPFASHCVLDAVSRIATPTPNTGKSDINVVFQQWGYVQHIGLAPRDIEDCVDSLLIPGGKLFPGGGGCELWSLPKILGTTGGGVLWCRSPEFAKSLRRLRDKQSKSTLMWILRLLGMNSKILHALWQGAEASLGRPSRFQTGEILAALETWDAIVLDRKKKLDIASHLAPIWLRPPSDRLPTVIPVEMRECVDAVRLASKMRIASGMRTIELVDIEGAVQLKRVLPIPIHQDVSLSQLNEMVNEVKCFVEMKP